MIIRDRFFSEVSGERYFSVILTEKEYSLFQGKFPTKVSATRVQRVKKALIGAQKREEVLRKSGEASQEALEGAIKKTQGLEEALKRAARKQARRRNKLLPPQEQPKKSLLDHAKNFLNEIKGTFKEDLGQGQGMRHYYELND